MDGHDQDGSAIDRRLVLLHAPARVRPGLVALLALDRGLGQILRAVREPIVGQMRLAWWREALARLDTAPPPAEPVLAALAADVVPRGVSGASLAAMIDGWEALLGDPLDRNALSIFATARGGGLFGAGAVMLDADDAMIAPAGEGWALADLMRHISDDAVAREARTMAEERLTTAFTRRWSRAARPLGMLALLARADLAGIPAGSPRRAVRLVAHRLTGR